uniref:Uncharacterized protein n=1 Tax=Romanomermis culicivorax TaxID=13658 RepID=A0A915HVH3_ROMCU
MEVNVWIEKNSRWKDHAEKMQDITSSSLTSKSVEEHCGKILPVEASDDMIVGNHHHNESLKTCPNTDIASSILTSSWSKKIEYDQLQTRKTDLNKAFTIKFFNSTFSLVRS